MVNSLRPKISSICEVDQRVLYSATFLPYSMLQATMKAMSTKPVIKSCARTVLLAMAKDVSRMLKCLLKRITFKILRMTSENMNPRMMSPACKMITNVFCRCHTNKI